MVADLDRHSAYLDAGEYQDIRITASGKYSGVGLEVSVLDGRIVVVSPIDGTPAARAGVESGDEILKIDDRLVTDENLDDTIELLRGTRIEAAQHLLQARLSGAIPAAPLAGLTSHLLYEPDERLALLPQKDCIEDLREQANILAQRRIL